MKQTNLNPPILLSDLEEIEELTLERDQLEKLALEITFARMNQSDVDRLGEIRGKIDRLKLLLIKRITTL